MNFVITNKMHVLWLSIQLDTDDNVERLRFGFSNGSHALFMGPTNLLFHQNFH